MKDIDKIKSFFQKNQRFPTYEEMTKMFKVASKNTVAFRVNRMIKEGTLKKQGRHLLIVPKSDIEQYEKVVKILDRIYKTSVHTNNEHYIKIDKKEWSELEEEVLLKVKI